MNFWQILAHVAPAKPMDGLAALWWHLTRRRVRARNILNRAAADMPFGYRYWMRMQQSRDEDSAEKADLSSSSFTIVILGQRADAQACQQSLRSVLAQSMGRWQIFLEAGLDSDDPRVVPLPAGSSIGAALAQAASEGTGDFLLPLLAGDRLASDALAKIGEAASLHPQADVLYGDQDHLDLKGERARPWFKPRWNPDMFLSQDYVSRSCAMRMEAVRRALSEQDDQCSPFSLILSLAVGEGIEVVHLPHILVHARSPENFPDPAVRARLIERQLATAGVQASEGPFGTVKVTWPLPDPPPLVSIIVPTRDKLELLEPCLGSVLAKTRYPHFELLVIDNGSVDPATLAYLSGLAADPRVRVLRDPRPYNYSTLNNEAVREALGDLVCLLNNDTEVINPEWLTELVRHAVRPEVGAVGAKLLYQDGTLQHAGVIVGMGDAAGHGHRFLPDKEPGYFAQPHMTQAVSAVTGACLCVSAQKYRSVGGLDEEALAVAYNDVDFCLKMGRAGWRNIYVPHAVLYHYESKSRAKDHLPSQIARYSKELRLFQERWGTKDYADPLFHPQLDSSSETFVIRLR